MLTTIPFSGFYNSIHSSLLDNALESMFSDSSGYHPTSKRLSEKLWGHSPYPVKEYSKAYVKAFEAKLKEETGLNISLSFESVSSPKEYNFTTDIIFAKISLHDTVRLRSYLGELALTKQVKREFTSRSGFISFYSPDVSAWGNFPEWDHNQVGCILSAIVSSWNDEWETYIMDQYSENGYLDNWIYAAMDEKGKELCNIASELRNAEECELPKTLSALRSEIERVEKELSELDPEEITANLILLESQKDALRYHLGVKEKEALKQYSNK